MKKFKLILKGTGAVCYAHDINEEQKNTLIDAGVSEGDADHDSVCEILGIDYIDQNARSYTGVYENSEDCSIVVFDENEKCVWESSDEYSLEPYINENDQDDERIKETNGLVLIAKESIKGTIKEYDLEINDDFDPKKLSGVYVDIAETIQLFIDLKYDGKELEDFEWGGVSR
jgi:hypothetical protein